MIKVTVTRINARASARPPRSVVVRVPGPQGPAGTASLGTVTVVNPDQSPNVTATGTARDRIYNFVLPRAAAVDVGTVTTLNPDQNPTVSTTVNDGDVDLDFGLPRAASFTVDDNVVSPNVAPSVTTTVTDGDIGLDFDLPRAATVTVGSTTTVNPDVAPDATSSTDVDGDVTIDFDLPRAPEVTLGTVTTVNPDVSPDVAFNVTGGDVEVDFDLPRAAEFGVEPVNVVNPDQPPDVIMTADDGDYDLEFSLPRAPQFAVGTVSTVNPGDPADVTDIGADGDIVLNFDIPQGEKGDTGEKGDKGDKGDTGLGIEKPIGPNGQILVANDANVSGTEWTSSIDVEEIFFDTAGAEVSTAGHLAWNAEEGTLDLGLNGGDVVLQLGQETLYRVKNQTGSTIFDGTLVQFAGTLGMSGILLVAPADTANIPPEFIMGVATEDILDGEDGYVTHFGKVRGIDTSMFSEGDILYADPAVVGGLTATEPSLPNVQVAAVVTSHPVVGEIFVRPSIKNASSIAALTDVDLTGLDDGFVLIYDDASGTWLVDRAAAGAKGGNDNEIFWENDVQVTDSYEITAGKNAGTFGPIEILQGVSVEVPAGSEWTII